MMTSAVDQNDFISSVYFFTLHRKKKNVAEVIMPQLLIHKQIKCRDTLQNIGNGPVLGNYYKSAK